MLQSPASESSSVGMLRSAPGSASREEPLNCGEVSEDESSPCLPRPCPRGCCSSSFDGVSRSMATGSRHAEMLQSPASREDHRSVMTASTPCAMVMSCETKVASPPKLELGDVPPSDEALSLECDTLLRIAEDDKIHDMITCSATSSGDASEPGCATRGDIAKMEEEEDFNFDFLHDDQEPDVTVLEALEINQINLYQRGMRTTSCTHQHK
jgi:hypothetical protein